MALNYCGNLVRQQDRDRYLLSLLYKEREREALWALFAFNHEIAKTREVVSETATGLIRLQWWRDAVDKIYEGVVLDHEVVKPLAEAIALYDLPKDLFHQLIYAREFDVEDRQPTTWDGFLTYVEATNMPLFKLALKVLDEEEGADVVRDIACLYGVVGCLRAVPFHLSQRRVYMPEDIMEAHGCSLTQLYDWKKYDTMYGVVKEVVGRLNVDIHAKDKFLRANKKLSDMHLKQIMKLDYNVFDARMSVEPPFKALRVWVS